MFGTDHIVFSDENIQIIKAFLERKQLYKAAKAMYRVYVTWKQLFEKLNKKVSILRDSKELIISTVDHVQESVGLKRAVHFFGISMQQYNSWKQESLCQKKESIVCYKRFPGQISSTEIVNIKQYLKDTKFIHWSMVSVYYKMMRDEAAYMSLSTFYKYAKLLKLHRSKLRKRRRLKYEGLKTIRPGQTLHLDLTIFKTLDNTRVYLYFLADNYSRYILGWRASLRYSSSVTFDLMKEVYEKYRHNQLKPVVDLIVDDGSENKGMLDQYLNQTHVKIHKLIAQKDIVFSNSMIEAVNKQMKYAYLFTRDFSDFNHVVKFLKEFAIDDYNNKPHYALYGLTPYEVYNGERPDRLMFHERIKEACKQRLIDNADFQCEDCEVITE